MIALALAISATMKESTLQSVGEERAATIAAVLGPSVQELENSARLSPETMARLDDILERQLSGRVMVAKIWLRDGTLTYATDKKLVGQKFPSHDLDSAFNGRVSASFDDMDHPENQFDRLLNLPLIEIYAPLYRTGSDKVIAVGEFYSSGARLSSELRTLQFASAGIVGAVTTPMLLVLYLIVHRANSAIGRHQTALNEKIIEAERLASLNEQLRANAEQARLEAGRSNERLLNQIGQDLHDGPIQLLGMLMLKLTEADVGSNSSARTADRPDICVPIDPRSLTARILKDIRDISTGLVLPQLEGLAVAEVVILAVRQHEYVTGTMVTLEIGQLPPEAPQVIKACLFRVVQEGLNNAFRHARGKDQRVECRSDEYSIQLIVSDGGIATARLEQDSRQRRAGLGLTGIQRRVEALGGSFAVSVGEGKGMVVRVTLPTAPFARHTGISSS
jgi:signal transduction histidine kinase